MKKTILSVLAIAACFTLSAQTTKTRQIDRENAREGEDVEYCITHKKYNELLADPVWAQRIAETELIRAEEEANGINAPKATVYYIPVVFHLLHNNGPEKISDEQILDAFEILNRDFRMQNADANNVVNAFNASNPSATSIPADAEIEFRLATKAPDGTCFSGITHTVSAASTNGTSGTGQVNAIKAGNDVYQGEWPGNKYMNIFICGEIGGAAGYTYNPMSGFTQMNNGIWILHQYVGSIGTGNPSTSRALTHEVGHWLNLSHPWGGNNNPGVSCGNDGVSDTPQTIGATACTLSSNTCSGDNGYWGFDQIDQVENYMDYSYCSKMYTAGQVTRMRNACTSGVGGRSNVISASNLIATGADGNPVLCRAEFSASKTTICAGETVDFDDMSFNAVNGWSWTFAGGSPASSNAQNPSVTYSTPGLYQVSLVATDGSSNDTETKTNYIRVLPAGSSLPLLEGFETFSTLDNIIEWGVENPGNNAKFELSTTVGLGSSKSARLMNFGQPAGNTDELTSAPVDLSGVTSGTGVTLSFRYAYRKRTSGNNEYLKVFVTNNCGDTWVQRKTIFGDQLSDISVGSSWTPSSDADWTTVHMTNVTSSYWVDDFRYKFVFESDNGNNFYLDNINIYLGEESDELVGLDELSSFNGLSLYPNPTDNELNLSFNLEQAQNVTIQITDVMGKTIQHNALQANEGSNLVMMNTSEFANGMYFLTIRTGSQAKTVQFVVK